MTASLEIDHPSQFVGNDKIAVDDAELIAGSRSGVWADGEIRRDRLAGDVQHLGVAVEAEQDESIGQHVGTRAADVHDEVEVSSAATAGKRQNATLTAAVAGSTPSGRSSSVDGGLCSIIAARASPIVGDQLVMRTAGGITAVRHTASQ